MQVEWRFGTEEGWLSSEALMLVMSAELHRDWTGSRVGFDVLLPM